MDTRKLIGKHASKGGRREALVQKVRKAAQRKQVKPCVSIEREHSSDEYVSMSHSLSLQSFQDRDQEFESAESEGMEFE